MNIRTRYRDLIDSADSILYMKTLSSQLFDTINKVEQNCNQLIRKSKYIVSKNNNTNNNSESNQDNTLLKDLPATNGSTKSNNNTNDDLQLQKQTGMIYICIYSVLPNSLFIPIYL